jgi:hypothetical protein
VEQKKRAERIGLQPRRPAIHVLPRASKKDRAKEDVDGGAKPWAKPRHDDGANAAVLLAASDEASSVIVHWP